MTDRRSSLLRIGPKRPQKMPFRVPTVLSYPDLMSPLIILKAFQHSRYLLCPLARLPVAFNLIQIILPFYFPISLGPCAIASFDLPLRPLVVRAQVRDRLSAAQHALHVFFPSDFVGHTGLTQSLHGVLPSITYTTGQEQCGQALGVVLMVPLCGRGADARHPEE